LGSVDYVTCISSCRLLREKKIETHIDVPPCLRSVGFIENLLFETTLTVVFLDGVPHMDRHKGFIVDETGDILPWISILKSEGIDFTIEFRGDFFMLELTKFRWLN